MITCSLLVCKRSGSKALKTDLKGRPTSLKWVITVSAVILGVKDRVNYMG